MRLEQSAGGVVFKQTRRGVRVLVIKNSYGHWAFPKGRIDQGELPVETAIREIREEAGIKDLRFKRSLGIVDFWFVDTKEQKGQRVHKLVYQFLFETPASEKGEFQKEEGIEALKWVTPKHLEKQLTYPSLADIARLTVRYLKRYDKPSIR